MKPPYTLFEVSWEVAHRIGGVHTSIASKARALGEHLNGAHLTVGPWLLESGAANAVLQHDPAYDTFAEACRQAGFPVKIGRWRIPGRPRTILVEFSHLLQRKDDLLAELWDRHGVDSLFGGWGYVEPVLFGHAAAVVIDLWWRHYLAGRNTPTVAQFHDWQTGAGLLHLARTNPAIGTVFTVHSTVLGSALTADGQNARDTLGATSPEEAAETLHVTAQHSLARAAATESDVFSAISDITAEEAERFYGRRPDDVVPNGIDQQSLRNAVGGVSRSDAAKRLREFASHFCGDDLSAATVIVSGARYEFHNKGFDLLLEAAAGLADKPGRPVVLILSVPAGNAGIRRDVAARLSADGLTQVDEPGFSTHRLFDEHDPIAVKCRALGIDNRAGSRVRVIHIPVYLDGDDGVLELSYLGAVSGADLACFPSMYEAWGYTPQESLALGVPTVTTDCAGFGLWALEQGLGPDEGLFVLERRSSPPKQQLKDLAEILDRVVRWRDGDSDTTASCTEVVCGTGWEDVLPAHRASWARAAETARARVLRGGVQILRRAVPLPVRSRDQSSRPRLFRIPVRPRLDPQIEGLRELAWNWNWVWNPRTRALFEELSPAAWEACAHNPVQLLRTAPQAELDAHATDEEFAGRVAAALARHRTSVETKCLTADDAPLSAERPTAYFCAEFAIHETLPIYSGGLGVLAGDHVRAASDLGVPFVAIGLLYRKGYFRQQLSGGATQTESPAILDPSQVALALVKDEKGDPLEVSLQLPGSTLTLRAWRAMVGRVPLYLLDADVPGNAEGDRSLTHSLYAGDSEHRLRQEIVLGRGGVRLLEALDISPSVFHINEGHGSFVAIERAAALHRDHGLTFEEAREVVRASTVFTTHTPVPAGHDRFHEDLIRRYFSDVSNWLGVTWERFYALGVAPADSGRFNMTVLALRFASFVNGVSRLHGDVSRDLLGQLYPQVLAADVPVGAITNGVHLATWAAPEIAEALGADERPVAGENFTRAAEDLDPARLWETRQAMRARFLEELREELESSFNDREDSADVLERTLDHFRDDALVIGFARRFATYKRAGLVFRDAERLARLLGNEDRPVRLLVAGKAHPKDGPAKDTIAELGRLARTDEFVGRVILLEDYDMRLARMLLQGVDVWLNTPRRPLEASGTSGMKAAANGALNLSIFDGWWAEGYDGTNGWRIGDTRVRRDADAQDAADAASLYALLEDEVIPQFFERDENGLPGRWLERVRRSLATIPAVYDTARMVAEYRDRAYVPVATAMAAVQADDFAGARAAARDEDRLARSMPSVRIAAASLGGAERAHPGDRLAVRIEVEANGLEPSDLRVELVAGNEESGPEDLTHRVELEPTGRTDEGAWIFEGVYELDRVGTLDYGLRVRPRRDDPALRLDDHVVWA